MGYKRGIAYLRLQGSEANYYVETTDTKYEVFLKQWHESMGANNLSIIGIQNERGDTTHYFNANHISALTFEEEK